MGSRGKSLGLVLAMFALLFFDCRDASAYLDPGTGSYIFQIIVAGILGALFTVKLYWNKIKTFVRSSLLGKKRDEQAEK